MAHPPIRCGWCEQTHPSTLLCDPARQVLDAAIARGRSYDMPTVEFDKPVFVDQAPGHGVDADSVILGQVVVKAAIIEAAGVTRAAIIITGRDVNRQPLPSWVYVGSDDEITAIAKLFADVSDMALRAARRVREAAGQ